MFSFQQTAIRGVMVVRFEALSDERGGFARIFCKREFDQAGLRSDFVQVNHSWNNKAGTFRGFHCQTPPAGEVKLIRCVSGAVYDIAVDLRRGSPTFLKWVGVELNESNGRQIYIPEGCAHGFITLTENAQLIYHHTGYYAPGCEMGVAVDDPRIGVRLPRDITVISEKDRRYPPLDPGFEGIRTGDAPI